MKAIYWNVKGLGNEETRLDLKKMCLLHKPDLVLVSEPCIDFYSIPLSFWKSIGLKSFMFNDRGNRSPNL